MMKQPNKRFLRFALTALAVLLLMNSCARLPALTASGDALVNEASGVRYYPVDSRYEAVRADTSNPVFRIKRTGMDALTLYTLTDRDDEDWLCDSSCATYVKEGIRLPGLDGWNPGLLLIYENNALTPEASVTDAAVLSEIVRRYTGGISFRLSELEEGLHFQSYDLRFSSEEIAGLSYHLNYRQYAEDVRVYQSVVDQNGHEILYPDVPRTYENFEYTEKGEAKTELLAVYHFGKGILYDRETGRCYPLDTLISDVLETKTGE